MTVFCAESLNLPAMLVTVFFDGILEILSSVENAVFKDGIKRQYFLSMTVLKDGIFLGIGFH